MVKLENVSVRGRRSGVRGLVFIAAVGLALAAAETTAQSDEELQQRKEELVAQIQDIAGHPEAQKEAIAAGRERAVLCSYCHGADGNSVKPDIPNLAGQNAPYLIEQIEKFADGRRKNFVMQTLASDFTMRDKVNLALYYTSQKVHDTEFDPDLASQGQQVYQRICIMCHGDDGHGEKGYARLAGQKPQYVINTLERFRHNAEQRAAGEEVVRANARMEQVAKVLSDEEIRAVAHYIAQLD